MNNEREKSEQQMSAAETVELTGNDKIESVAYSISREGEDYVIRYDLKVREGVDENDAQREFMDVSPTMKSQHPTLEAAEEELKRVVEQLRTESQKA